MTTIIENFIVAVILLAAALWLARRIYRTVVAATMGGASSCGACGHCAKSPAQRSPVLIAISAGGERNQASNHADQR